MKTVPSNILLDSDHPVILYLELQGGRPGEREIQTDSGNNEKDQRKKKEKEWSACNDQVQHIILKFSFILAKYNL